MDFTIDKRTAKRLEHVAELGREWMRPLGQEADRLGRPVPPDHVYFRHLLDLGYGRTRWSPDGKDSDERAARRNIRGGSAVSAVIIAEEMAYWDRGVAVAGPGPGLGEPPILSMGTPEQKERFLSPFVEPDKPRWGAFAMTEPSGGSDVANIKTRAVKDGNNWVLNGAKSFSGNSSRADWIVVWATVDPTLGRAGHRAFVVENGTPGLENFKIERKMGLKAYESTSFFLSDCRVPGENLLGGEEHYEKRAGFKGAMQTFNAGRPAVAANAIGIGRAALDEAISFARQDNLLADIRLRDRLERVRRKLNSARLLALKAAWLADQKQANILEASTAKAVAPLAALEATSLGMEIIGEVGAAGEHLIEKLFRDVKAMDIVEGTGQIQRIIIARKLVGLPRD